MHYNGYTYGPKSQAIESFGRTEWKGDELLMQTYLKLEPIKGTGIDL